MYLTIKLQLQATHDEKQILRAYSRRFQDEVERIIRRYQKLGSVIFIPYKWVSSDIAFYSKIRYCTMRRLCMRSADCSIGPCIPAVFPVWRNLCSLRRIQLYSRLAKAFLFLNCVSERNT